MTALTSALIDYWQKLPQRPSAARRRLLDEVHHGVRCGERDASALIPFALADSDDEVVGGATAAFLAVAQDEPSRTAAAHDASEWVRRGLACNRGAVFAALLLRGEERVNEKLLPLRLTLSEDDVATVCRRVARRSCERSRAFLQEWHELLAGEAMAQQRAHIAASLAVEQPKVA